ncbi:YdeI/OmpD-associated family protein [Streptosporangium sp. NPDC006007]|uniref:YdeI/OmpD-associated family protein n=1 Tax=Streptosporangium sp. NPDC006007 TaxID=3154575 RepID=UPI0033B86AC2
MDLMLVAFGTPDEWEAWLAEHHETSVGVWLKIAKKDSGIATVSYAEALDIALCYGWIDGRRDRVDDEYWQQRFSPRRAGSKWSKNNRNNVAKLLEQGRMKPAGLLQVEAAKTDGRWDAAYESQSTITVPDDLQRALERNPAAQEFFTTLDSRNRYAVLYRVQDAKKPETRARRIEKYVAMLGEQKKIYP